MAGKGNHRAPWHDYRSRARYMVTLAKAPDAPAFGRLAGQAIAPSATGAHIKGALASLPAICPAMRLWQYAVMPDHLHLLISVERELDEPLGCHIARLKAEANRRCGAQVFAQGFNDQIITPARSLDAVFKYIKDNPRRLAVRFAHPDYFRRISQIEIAGRQCQAYGNLSLLQNPFKEPVVCHRADTDATRTASLDRWLYAAANGGVLISPFISSAEKGVRIRAEEAGGKLILITNRPLAEREKPTAHDFGLCEQGRLLTIAPLGLPSDLTRAACLSMNALAAALAHPSI